MWSDLDFLSKPKKNNDFDFLNKPKENSTQAAEDDIFGSSI